MGEWDLGKLSSNFTVRVRCYNRQEKVFVVYVYNDKWTNVRVC